MPPTLATAQERTQAARIIRAGYRYSDLEALASRLALSADQLLKYLRLSRSTVRSRAATDAPLSPTESDLIYRADRVLGRAVEAFGDASDAAGWLKHPQRALGGVAPLSLVDTTAGFEQVMDELGRIEYGAIA